MGTTETYQYVSEDPRFVAYKEGLLQDASDFVRNQMGFNMVLGEDGQPKLEPILDPETGQPIGPAYQPIRKVAGLTTPEQEAIALAQQGVGSYEPFLQRGLDASETALQGLEGAAGEFDPSGISAFMNPYEQQAIDYALQDIADAGEQQKIGARGQAVGAGAFGGSRSGIVESELGRNILEQQAKTAAQMRMAGYQDAATRAQQAFEAGKGRGLQASQLAGNLGQGIAGLGGWLNKWGLRTSEP
jgi:hypothetical protein